MATAASDRRRELARSGLHQGARQHRHFGFGILDVNYSFPTTTDTAAQLRKARIKRRKDIYLLYKSTVAVVSDQILVTAMASSMRSRKNFKIFHPTFEMTSL